MNKNQKGFSILEVSLLVVLVGIISATAWYVWHARHNINSLAVPNDSTYITANKNNTTTGSGAIHPLPKAQTIQKAATPTDFSQVSSTSCQDVWTQLNSQVQSTWQTLLAQTVEVQNLQTEKSAKITYKVNIGTVCTLSNGQQLVSYIHVKNMQLPNGNIKVTNTYGFFIFTGDEKTETAASTGLTCADLPQSNGNPPSVTKVSNGVLTSIACPGDKGSIYSYSLKTGAYTKV